MSDSTGKGTWKECEQTAESIGPFGCPDRAAMDRITISRWVETIAPWDTFFTGTFAREGVTVVSAARRFEAFSRRSLARRPVIYFIEENKKRGDGGHHVHALIDGCSCRRDALWHRWFKFYGYARVLPITEVGGVAGYCAKLAPYVSKTQSKGGLWWNILNAHRAQGRLSL